MLNYKPIFDPPLKKLLGESPSSVGCRLARLGHSIARAKISERSSPRSRNMVFRKIRFSGYSCTSKSPKLVDQSLLNFFAQHWRKRCRSNSSDFGYLYPFRKYSKCSKWEKVRNWAKISVFFAPKLFLGSPPKFLDWRYEIEHASKHDAKFRADRPMDLGDYTLKKNCSKTLRPSGNYRSGRPNKTETKNKQERPC